MDGVNLRESKIEILIYKLLCLLGQVVVLAHRALISFVVPIEHKRCTARHQIVISTKAFQIFKSVTVK